MTVPESIIESSLSRIFETMYFVEIEWAGSGAIASGDCGVGATISFSGTVSGELSIAATSRLAVQLAADFLAVESSELAPGEDSATIEELANVACGSLLAEWMPEGQFEFGIPAALTPAEIDRIWPVRFAIGTAPAELAAEVRIAV